MQPGRFSFPALMATVLLFCMPMGVWAAKLTAPVDITIVAQQPGTSMYLYGTTLSHFLQDVLPKDSKVTVVPRGAAMVNPTVLDQGKGDITFSTSCATQWAWDGLEEVYGKYGKHKNIRYVSIGELSVHYTFACARREYVEKTGNDTLEKVLKAKDMPRIATKPEGSQVGPIFSSILARYNRTFDEFRKAGKLIQLQPTQIGEMLRDGRADVYFESIPPNHPGFVEVSMTNDLVFLPLPEPALNEAAKLGMTASIMPKGSYKGVDEDYKTLSTSHNILAHKDANEEAIYLLTKSLVERRKQFLEENPTLRIWDPEKEHDRTGIPIPLHPGAERYYRELGWVK